MLGIFNWVKLGLFDYLALIFFVCFRLYTADFKLNLDHFQTSQFLQPSKMGKRVLRKHERLNLKLYSEKAVDFDHK